MTHTTSALVVLDEHVDRGVVETLLTSSTQLVVADFVDLAGRDVERGDGDVLIMACAEFTAPVGEFVSLASRLHPGRPVVLVYTTGANGHVREAIAAGADDILTLPPNIDLQ